MLHLSSLLADLPEARVIGDPDRWVREVRLDSRQVTRGDVFVAIPGRRLDGARFARQAVEQGAAAVVAERADLDVPDGTPIVVVPCARKALAALAARRWDKPTHKLGLVGVTGTDGKTTTTILTAAMLEAAGH